MKHRHIDFLPGKSPRVLVVNSLLLMRAGYAKSDAMYYALIVAGYRPPKELTPKRLMREPAVQEGP
jgi:hypothetical protein